MKKLRVACALMSVAFVAMFVSTFTGGTASAGTPGTGGAQGATSLTVTPSSGLHDGDKVQVSGAGFAPGPLTIWMCDDNPGESGLHCSTTNSFNTTVDNSSWGPIEFTVHSTVTPQAPGSTPIQCNETGNCSVAATNSPSTNNPGAWEFVGFGGAGATTTTGGGSGSTTSTTSGSGSTTTTTHGATTTTTTHGATTTTAGSGSTTSTTSGGTTTTTSSTSGSTTSTTAGSTTSTTGGSTSAVPSDQGSIAVTPGQRTTISGNGFAPNQTLGGTFNSTPTSLGTTTSDAAGRYSVAVAIPADATPGQHTIVFAGPKAGGGTLQSVTTVTVQVGATGTLTLTGALTQRLVLLAGILIFAGAAMASSDRGRAVLQTFKRPR